MGAQPFDDSNPRRAEHGDSVNRCRMRDLPPARQQSAATTPVPHGMVEAEAVQHRGQIIRCHKEKPCKRFRSLLSVIIARNPGANPDQRSAISQNWNSAGPRWPQYTPQYGQRDRCEWPEVCRRSADKDLSIRASEARGASLQDNRQGASARAWFVSRLPVLPLGLGSYDLFHARSETR